MEKTWENFWATGRVDDYLSYRNSISEKEEENSRDNEAMRTQEGTKGTWDSR